MADTNTVIGETILARGNLQGDEDLTIRGRVEGAINLTRTLIIEPSGVVKAEVSVNNAVVSGVMVGNITATDSVEITESGRMVGDISAPRVIIVEGARFKGKVDMGDIKQQARPAAQAPAARSTYTASRPSAPARPSPARPAPARPVPPPRPAARPQPATKPANTKPSAASPAKPVAARAPAKKKKVVLKKKR